MAQTVKHLSTVRETQVQTLGWEDPLEKKMAAYSSILAWEIPWTEEPGKWGCKELDMTSLSLSQALYSPLQTFYSNLLKYK